MSKSFTSRERTPTSEQIEGNRHGRRARADCASVEAPVHDSLGFVNIRPQAKLTIGQPGDPCEREADQVADQVTQMPGAEADMRAQRMCKACDDGVRVQQKPDLGAHGGELVASSTLERSIDSLSGHGRPLSGDARAFMEPRFGRSFGDVRVHTQAPATQAAWKMGARAFTLGQDIAFAPGQYAPGSGEGRRLLAHELTHVVQQSDGRAAQRGLHRKKLEAGTVHQYGRDLDTYPSFDLTHQFITVAMLPKGASPESVAKENGFLGSFGIAGLALVDLGAELLGFTIGGFPDGGALVAKFNQEPDIWAVDQSFNPCYDGPDYEPEAHLLSPEVEGGSHHGFVTKILTAVKNYQNHTQKHPIHYDFDGSNCNTFVYSLLAFIRASGYTEDLGGGSYRESSSQPPASRTAPTKNSTNGGRRGSTGQHRNLSTA